MNQVKRMTTFASAAIALALALLPLGCFQSGAGRSEHSQENQGDLGPAKESERKIGLQVNDPRALQGYTLLLPMMSGNSYLIDMQGKVVQQWETDSYPALSGYLLENGNLLRTGTLALDKYPFGGPGVGGKIQEFNWDGDLVWDFTFCNAKQVPHHDITPLPNGNVLMIVFESKTVRETIAAGFRKRRLSDSGPFRLDCIIEIKPTGKTTGEIAWEWHAWDHLIQDFDSSRANYGDVAKHPELIDLNFGEGEGLAPLLAKKDALDKLRSIGYLRSPPNHPYNPDWMHVNSVAYNPELDQIMLSVLGFSEIWIIDHSTTTAEAAGHSGGRRGKGGDLLYRWGNPRAYRAGSNTDQQLFMQHSAHWIAPGFPGAGHLLVFNNGLGRTTGKFSSVEEIILPVDSQGQYVCKPGAAFGPDKPIWSYTAPKPTDFCSEHLSSSQRLKNGNTLVCSGDEGRIFEITPKGEVVWDYRMASHVRPDMVDPSRRQSWTPTTDAIFCAWRYASNFPGLAGKVLTPGKSVEELEPTPGKQQVSN